MYFSFKITTHFFTKTVKRIFPPNHKMYFSAKITKHIFYENHINIFPAKTTKRIFRQNQKYIFPPKPQNTFFCQNRKNTFFAKTTKTILVKTTKRIFSGNSQDAFSHQNHKKTHIPSRTMCKMFFSLKPQKCVSCLNYKFIFSIKTTKSNFLTKTANFIFHQNQKITFFSIIAKLYFPPKPQNYVIL